MTADPGVLDALDATRDSWRSAYFREPTGRGERALAFLFADDVGEDDDRAGIVAGAVV